MNREQLEEIKYLIASLKTTTDNLRYIESIGKFVKETTATKYNKLVESLNEKLVYYAEKVAEYDTWLLEVTKDLYEKPFKSPERIRYVLDSKYKYGMTLKAISKDIHVSSQYVAVMITEFWRLQGDELYLDEENEDIEDD